MRLASTAVSVLAVGLISSAAHADANACKKVNAAIVTSLILCPVDFQSPVGLCTSGNITSGPLMGSTLFRALTLTPLDASGTVFSYTGELIVTTARGTVTIQDRGVVDFARMVFLEVDQVVGGTGTFRSATGLLTSQGSTTGAGFSGTITGRVCRARHHDKRRDRDGDDDDHDDSDRDE